MELFAFVRFGVPVYKGPRGLISFLFRNDGRDTLGVIHGHLSRRESDDERGGW